jgi:ketosteroid isomerase-like protein
LLETTSSAAIKDTRLSVLHAAFDAVIQGNYEAFGERVTEDVELSIIGFSALDGSWRGRDEVIAATRRNFAQGDRIAVLLREKGILQSNGQPYSVRGVQWFTFVEDKIKRIDEIVASV